MAGVGAVAVRLLPILEQGKLSIVQRDSGSSYVLPAAKVKRDPT
jgi:hypothetical protein